MYKNLENTGNTAGIMTFCRDLILDHNELLYSARKI